jgi:hypothetical protein
MRGFAIFLDKRGDTIGFRFWPATGQTIQFVPIDAAHWRVGGIRQSAGRVSSFRRRFSFGQFHNITLSLCPAFASSSRQPSWQATILHGDFSETLILPAFTISKPSLNNQTPALALNCLLQGWRGWQEKGHYPLDLSLGKRFNSTC